MKNSTTLISFITAFSLHVIVGAVLLLGVDFSLPTEKKKEQVIINASVVSQKLFDDLAQRKNQQVADKVAAEKRKIEQKRKEQARIKREQQLAEKKRKETELKRVQAEKEALARKKKEQDRILFEKIVAAKELRAKEEAQKAKKVADAKRKEQEIARKKQEAALIEKQKTEIKRIKAEKLAASKALKVKQAKEAKIKADKVVKAKKEAEHAEQLRQAELDKQMQAEFEDSFSIAQSSKELSEIARYKALIQAKISRNWQVDPSMKGKTCTLAIRLASDGLVLAANRSRGDERLCASAKRATLSAKTLPIPKDPEIALQFRDFDITLEPDL